MLNCNKKIKPWLIAIAMICTYHEKALLFPPLSNVDFKYEIKKRLGKKVF